MDIQEAIDLAKQHYPNLFTPAVEYENLTVEQIYEIMPKDDIKLLFEANEKSSENLVKFLNLKSDKASMMHKDAMRFLKAGLITIVEAHETTNIEKDFVAWYVELNRNGKKLLKMYEDKGITLDSLYG